MTRSSRALVPLVIGAAIAAGCSGGSSSPDVAVTTATTAPRAEPSPPPSTVPSASAPATNVPTTPTSAATAVDTTESVTTTEPPTQAIATVPAEASLLQVLADHPELTVLADLVAGYGQDGVFTQARGVTLLALDDAAMNALGADRLEEFRSNPDAFTLFLSDLLTIGELPLDTLVADGQFVGAGGTSLTVVSQDGVVTIGGATVVDGDLAAENGVVHVLDGAVAAEG